jgi:PAS domain S-box-containing protein
LRAQRKEQEQALRLRQLLDGTPITIAVHQGGRFTYVNEAGARLLGFASPEKVIGTDIRHIIHPESLELATSRIREAEQQKRPLESAEERLRRVDGGIVDVEMHTTGFLEDGLPSIQVVAVDITRRKEAERQLQALLLEQEFLLREVQHRVKNNLQVVISLVSLQSLHAKELETRKALQEVQDRLQTLALIHQRLEPAPQRSPVDLSHFLEQLAQRLTRSYALDPGQVDLDMRMAPLHMDAETATRLGMLLNELLSNCFKHAFPLGRRGRVEVRLWAEDDGEVHLVVGDDGPGLPPGTSLETATSLGFQILLSLTEQLKGNLRLEEGLGCTFHLRFPAPGVP